MSRVLVSGIALLLCAGVCAAQETPTEREAALQKTYPKREVAEPK